MRADRFIARRLRFKGKMAVISMAISFLVITIALAVSAGYRQEIRSRLSALYGDVVLTLNGNGEVSEAAGTPMKRDLTFLPKILALPEVESARPVAIRGGIARNDGLIQAVIFKGVPDFEDTSALSVSVPTKLAKSLHLKKGDTFQSYFIGGEKAKARVFTVADIYDSIIEADGTITVYTSLENIQRINSWDENQISSYEITLSGNPSRDEIKLASSKIGTIAFLENNDSNDIFLASSLPDRFPQLFDWLDLISVNVLAVLVLMIAVAGFNMISGLLIMLFRNISTIGLLKSVGMSNSGIARVFLKVASRLVLEGMLIGNALAVLLVAVQGKTHFLSLDPSNYFISFVPMKIEWNSLISCDILAFIAVMLLLLIPSLFIAKVDPSKTIKTD